MELKKWRFEKGEYTGHAYVAFGETIEECIKMINEEEEEEFEEDDFYIEELEIQNPSKAYKGYYDEYYNM